MVTRPSSTVTNDPQWALHSQQVLGMMAVPDSMAQYSHVHGLPVNREGHHHKVAEEYNLRHTPTL